MDMDNGQSSQGTNFLRYKKEKRKRNTFIAFLPIRCFNFRYKLAANLRVACDNYFYGSFVKYFFFNNLNYSNNK